MPKNPFIHVVHKDNSWVVEEEGRKEAMSAHNTKEEAINAGRNVAKQNMVELIIHNMDGRISERNSYGNDPRNVPG
jgi:hypothetical protein